MNINNELKELGINQKYIFHFLGPNSYPEFFEYLKDGRLIKGVSGANLKIDWNQAEKMSKIATILCNSESKLKAIFNISC